MICASIQKRTAAQIKEICAKVEMAEVRLDLCRLTDDEIADIFRSATPLVATCRAVNGDYVESVRKLALSVLNGALYADLEVEAPRNTGRQLREVCSSRGAFLIRSYHNFSETPAMEELRRIVDECFGFGCDVAKVVVTAECEEDALRVLDLYKYYDPRSLVAFAMSPEGTPYSSMTRLECLRRGAPFSYCCPDDGERTASGQLSYSRMYAKVYAGRRAVSAGGITVPASKSYAQRAIIAAALSDGESVLEGFTPCADSVAAIDVAKSLGASVESQSQTGGPVTLKIRGIAASASCLEDSCAINVGESGLLTRLMIPLGAQLCRQGMTIEGSGTLLKRPLKGTETAMGSLGACVSAETVPLTVKGPLKGGHCVIDGSKSSQLVSGAVMALPLCTGESTLEIKNPASVPYIRMTVSLLEKFGVRVCGAADGNPMIFGIKGGQRYVPASFRIEGDWSAAAVFLAAGAVFGQARIEGLTPTSLQADRRMVDILRNAGASLRQPDGPDNGIIVKKAPLRAVREDLSDSPDLFPVVAVLCAFCPGRNVLCGVNRLLHKESDRARGIMEMLSSMGVKVQVRDNEMEIWGESLVSRIMNGRLLKGGKFTSANDHRMVMALSLAALGADSPVETDDCGAVAKSFPEFNRIWYEHVWKKLQD